MGPRYIFLSTFGRQKDWSSFTGFMYGLHRIIIHDRILCVKISTKQISPNGNNPSFQTPPNYAYAVDLSTKKP